MYYCEGERAERDVAIVVHKSILRSAVKKGVCNDRIIATKLKAEPVNVLIVQAYMPTRSMKIMKWKSCTIQLKKFLRKMEKGTQTTS